MQEINGVDYGIIGIISVSVLFGVVRGFVREAMSLITWVTAITIGILYHESVAQWFSYVTVLWVRLLLAFVSLVLIILIIGGILSHLFAKLIKSTKFSITDRIVGTLFGIARGGIIVAAALLFINLMDLPRQPLLEGSKLLATFEPISLWIEEKLPEDLLKAYGEPHKKKEKVKKEKEMMETELDISDLLKDPS